MTLWLRVGGVPATEIAAHTPPTWEHLADGGCGSVSWAFALSLRSQHPAVRVRSKVEVMYGPMPVHTTMLTEPDRTTWECHAYGLSSWLRKCLALDGSGTPTRDIAVAIAHAIAVGVPVSNPYGLAGVVAGNADSPITVGELLDQRALELGQRWGTDGRGAVYMRPDPTTPSLMTAPGAAAFAPTDEDAPSRLIGVYWNGTTYAKTTVGSGVPEEPRDLTDRGTLTVGQAQAILSGELLRQGPTGWVNSVTLQREQFLGIGGNPANLVADHSQKMMRAHGLMSNALGVSLGQDVVIGKTTYTAGEQTITIEPVNKAPRDLAGVIAAA